MSENWVLVTGANGQLGNELRRLASATEGCNFVFTDVKELDITQPDAIHAFLMERPFRWVVNCAAYTAVDKAETERELASRINALAPGYLAQASRSIGAAMIHISTDYVFSGKHYRPYKPEDPTGPESFYGLTKLQGEQAVRDSGVDAFIIRTAWLYSEFGNNFVKTILKYGKERGRLNVVSDQIGSPTWAADLAAFIMYLISSQQPGGTEILHYTNEGICSWYDFAWHIIQLAGIECIIHPIPSEAYPLPAPRPFYSVLDKKHTVERTGIQIPHWYESLRRCLPHILRTF
ncbi:MAG: dTDP-4-dehydrorhamnose reductase [Bacteroidales bacterium]